MFWRRDKPLQVELVTPINLTTASAATYHGALDKPVPEEAKTNTDLAFKLITFGALVSQAALAIIGYSLLVGKLQQFGIDPSEISLSTPTLLLYGYTSLFSSALDLADRLPIIGTILLMLPFLAIAALFVAAITRKLKTSVVAGLASWIGIAMLAVFFAPGAGVQYGRGTGLVDFKKYTQLETAREIDAVDTVVTDKGERLVGHLILADSKSTFLLVGRTLFKLDGTTGRVIRETELKQRPPEMEKLPPKA
ncbi:hypothetical protein AO260_19985 [Pseudomonas sp. ABAC21]|nr:hypothetical protein AO260_19985 [Pseudomonas sp. ABAC21]